MLDNGSMTSLASSQGSTRSRTKSWRKPIPPYLPDPHQRLSPLSESDILRQWKYAERDFSYSDMDHPPLPENWQEKIQEAKHLEHHVERPAAPTPDSSSDYSAESEDAKSIADHAVKPAAETQHVGQLALYVHDDRQQSDAGSTLAESTRSTKLETVVNGTPGASIKTRSSSRKSYSTPPPIERKPIPSPRAPLSKSRRPDVDDVQHQPTAADAFRIVYPESSIPHMGQMNRNAAVFPVLPGSATDMSTAMTAVDSREDGRSTLQSLSYLSMPVPAPMKREGSMSSYHASNAGVRSAPSRSMPGCQSLSWWYVVKQTMKSAFCMQPGQVQS